MNRLFAPTIQRLVPRSLPQKWLCVSCRQTAAPLVQPLSRHVRSRFSSTTSELPKAEAQPNPNAHQKRMPSAEEIRQHFKQKNRTTMNYVISVILLTTSLAYGSVPMYKMICQTTGWGGQPVRAHGGTFGDPDADHSDRMVPVKDAKPIRVLLHASVSDVLPWKFVPQQREIRVQPGETALAFYTATNKSATDIIGVATYSVTPAQVAPYFSKIQCFCFEEQRLAAGESVDMPVFFYIDPDVLKDVNMRHIDTVVLNYTFFKAKYDSNGNFTSPLSGK